CTGPSDAALVLISALAQTMAPSWPSKPHFLSCLVTHLDSSKPLASFIPLARPPQTSEQATNASFLKPQTMPSPERHTPNTPPNRLPFWQVCLMNSLNLAFSWYFGPRSLKAAN